ncbi:cell division protein ZapE [Pseudohongiella spirulinae]
MQMASPRQRYQADLDAGKLTPDPAQRAAIEKVQQLYEALLNQSNRHSRLSLNPLRWLRVQAASSAAPQGIYFYGGVGRGKTYIMDLFYESLPFTQKQRTHFHRFMQQVHAALAALKNQKNPLELVAGQIAGSARVLCFDEFFVSDIGDAMILGGLLEHLMARNVVLVATSNIHPDGLYANGLQRARFLPAIELLKKHTQIVELDGGVDYRLRTLQQACLYFHPLGADAEAGLLQAMERLSSGHAEISENVEIEVLGRAIKVRRVCDEIAWFDCRQLCDGARSAFDYIELARLYHTIILSDVPQMDGDMDNIARRFVSLVDELYDRHVKLIISAAVPLTQLYSGHDLAFVFERTRSRLLEMQSEEYLAREHRP